MRQLFVYFVLLLAAVCTEALSYTGGRLLVVIDEVSHKSKYSKLFKDIEDRSFDVDYHTPKEAPALFLLGERRYDHVLLLPTKLKAYGPNLSPNALLDFAKAEGNILVALSSSQPPSSSLSSLLLELDIHLPADRQSIIVDHFNYDTVSANEQHDVIVLPAPRPLRSDVKDYFSSGISSPLVVPRAIGHVLGNESPLLSPILSAPSTAYSYNSVDEADISEDPFAVGAQLKIVSAMQARNNARVTVIGSAEMLQDTWFDAQVERSSLGKKKTGGKVKTGNQEFAKRLTAWTFKELGVIIADDVKHFLASEPEKKPLAASRNSSDSNMALSGQVNAHIYRIKNDVTYQVTLSEYYYDHLIPYEVPLTDALQLEFTMLNPYHRLNLASTGHASVNAASADPNGTIFRTTFKLPDQHGIFNFRLNYKRPYLTYLDLKDSVTVRHFAHDEWPRSFAISGAWVWIIGIFGTVAGWLAFVFVWLYSEPTSQAAIAKKKQ